MIVLTECQYFPPVILIKAAIDFSHVEFELYEDHRKMSFRNRCVIAGSSGPVNLSIPLADGRNQRRPLHEVVIDDRTDWQAQHWKTLTSCYNRSPWFEFYSHELEEIFRQPFDTLASWNRVCWNWVMEKLDAGITTSYTKKYVESYDPGAYLDWRNKLMPRSIKKEFPEPVMYRQVFEDRIGFLPHLSILDLLFCEGRRTVEILKSSKIPI
jgi:hypothetical protein